jgi:hypothetical protein
VTTYLNGLVAHNPSVLPAAADIKFTEDNVRKKLGEGLWQTATRLRAFRQDILDVKQNTAASLVVLEEGGSPALFTLRLKIADQKISEIETMVVRTLRGPDPVLVPWEIFKVYSGQIHAVEAFMKVFPASMGTGWE